MEELEVKKERLEKEQEINEAKKLLDFFLKALKNIMIYPEDNPIPFEFKKGLYKKFKDFLEKNGEFKIQVDSTNLLYQNEVIYHDQSKDVRMHQEKSIAFFIYRDGIREIKFEMGLPEKELNSFLEILKLVVKRLVPEDDLVTLLWGKDFNFIKYEVVDEILAEELSYSTQVFSQPDFEKLYHSEIDLPETEEEKKVKGEKVKIFVENIKAFAEGEITDLNKLLAMDQKYHPLEATISVFIEILNQEELPDFYEMVGLIEKGLDLLIETYDFASTYKIIEAIKQVEQRFSGISKERSERLKIAVERAGDKRRIEIIGEILNREKKVDLFSVQDYLCSLYWNSISNLINILGELKTFSARKMVCRVLEKFGRENLELVGKGVFDSRWYVVRNILWVLGEIEDRRGVEFVNFALKHEDVRVRREAVRILEKIGDSNSGTALIPLLDYDFNKIRIMAVKILAKWKVKEAIKPLLEIAEKKEFHNIDIEEKKELLLALAIIGQDEIIPFFRKLLRKRAFFNRGKKIETKILAIKALGVLNFLKAKNLLTEIKTKRNKILKEASAKALAKLELLPKT